MIIEPVQILSNSNLYIKKCNRERHLAYLDVICLINNILKGVDAGIEVDTTSTPFYIRRFRPEPVHLHAATISEHAINYLKSHSELIHGISHIVYMQYSLSWLRSTIYCQQVVLLVAYKQYYLYLLYYMLSFSSLHVLNQLMA